MLFKIKHIFFSLRKAAAAAEEEKQEQGWINSDFF